MTDPDFSHEDDPDDVKQDWLDRQARGGWTTCRVCGTTLHDDDIAEGTGCLCPDDEA